MPRAFCRRIEPRRANRAHLSANLARPFFANSVLMVAPGREISRCFGSFRELAIETGWLTWAMRLAATSLVVYVAPDVARSARPPAPRAWSLRTSPHGKPNGFTAASSAEE